MSTSNRFLLPWKIHWDLSPKQLKELNHWIKDWSKMYFNFWWVFKQNLEFIFPFPKPSCFCPSLRMAPINWGWTWLGLMLRLWDLKDLFQPQFHDCVMKPQRNGMNPWKWSKLSLGGWAQANCGNYWPTLGRIFTSQEYFPGMW